MALDPTTMNALMQMAVARAKYGDKLDSARRSRTDKLAKYGTQASTAGAIAKMVPAMAGALGTADQMGWLGQAEAPPATPLSMDPQRFGTVGGQPGLGAPPKSVGGYNDYADALAGVRAEMGGAGPQSLEQMMEQLRQMRSGGY